jgi:hypothetical protein
VNFVNVDGNDILNTDVDRIGIFLLLLMVLIFWDVDIDRNLSRYYRRSIDIWDDMSIQRVLVINIF